MRQSGAVAFFRDAHNKDDVVEYYLTGDPVERSSAAAACAATASNAVVAFFSDMNDTAVTRAGRGLLLYENLPLEVRRETQKA